MSKKFGSKHADPTVKEVVDTDSEEYSDDDDMSEEEFDLVEAMNEMTVGERKKVYALKGITTEYKKLRQQYFEELAAAELKALAIETAIAEERRKIVCGEREPTAEEIEKGNSYDEPSEEEKAGLKWLEDKAKEEGVRKLKSGLLFKVLKEGEGKKSPTANDPCDVHYHGTLTNGKKFDSSYDLGEPATFKPTEVINGWTEALQLMKEGDQWEVYLPYNLAYGAAGSPPSIPGYSTLVFKMELIKVKRGGKSAADAAKKLEQSIATGEEESTEEPKAKKGVKVMTPGEKKDAEEAATKGGIPRFWLHAFKNSEVLDSMIVGERDEDALAALEDVRLTYVDDNFKKGFKVHFHFGENEFFTNKVLSKTFLMDEEDDDEDGGALEQTIGTDIDWKSAEKNLTVVIKQKKQRHKSGKGIRIVNKEEKVPSFFNFFRTPEEPASDCDDDEEIEMFQEQMEMDFEAGMALRSGIVSRPGYYYSGKSVEAVAEQLRQQFGFGDEDDSDMTSDEDDESDDEDDDVPQRSSAPAGRGRGGAAPKPGGKQDCKQQ